MDTDTEFHVIFKCHKILSSMFDFFSKPFKNTKNHSQLIGRTKAGSGPE